MRRDTRSRSSTGGRGSAEPALCQLTADASAARARRPVEATALGNVLVQARPHGAVGGDLQALRPLVAATTSRGGSPRPRSVHRSAKVAEVKVALPVACVKGRYSPMPSRPVTHLPPPARRGRRGTWHAHDLLRPADGEHRLPRRGGCRWCAPSSAALRGLRRDRHPVRVVRRVGAAPALIVARRSGDAALAEAVGGPCPAGLRAQRVPRRRASVRTWAPPSRTR